MGIIFIIVISLCVIYLITTRLNKYKNKIVETKLMENATTYKETSIITTISVYLILVVVIFPVASIPKLIVYSQGVTDFKNGNIGKAYEEFSCLNGYKDAERYKTITSLILINMAGNGTIYEIDTQRSMSNVMSEVRNNMRLYKTDEKIYNILDKILIMCEKQNLKLSGRSEDDRD